MSDNLSESIFLLARELHEVHKSIGKVINNNAVLERIAETECKIMSKISEFAARQTEFNARQQTAVDGLTADVKVLNDKITELQNSPGEITPEDQVLLDDIEARNLAITEKLEALDAQTPPTPPPA